MQEIAEFRLVGTAEFKGPMTMYMKNKFFFIGLLAPARKQQSKELIKASGKLTLEELLAAIDELYQRSEREYQYVAIDICFANIKRFSFVEIQVLVQYVTQKSWWDSVDAWRRVFGKYVQLHPGEKRQVFELFYKHSDFWMRASLFCFSFLKKKH